MGTPQSQLQALRTKWVGRLLWSTRACRVGSQPGEQRTVTDVGHDVNTGTMWAYAGEHVTAGNVESLECRLESLTVR